MKNTLKQFIARATSLVSLLAVLMFWHGAAYADWRDDIKTLRLGIVGGTRPAIAMRQAEPFRHALQQALGIKVRLVAVNDLAALIAAQEKLHVDYAVHTASSFATTWIKCRCVQPLAAAMLEGQVETFYSVLVVNADEISTVSQLQGKRLAVPGKNSVTGYIIPAGKLPEMGVTFGDAADNNTELVMAGSAEKAAMMFLGNKVDGLLGWSTMSGLPFDGYSAGTLNRLVKASGKRAADFSILWQSPPITNGPHAVSNKLPEEAKAIIVQFLLELYDKNPAAYDAVENYRSGGFASVKLDDYQLLIDLFDAKKGKEKPPEQVEK
jgi:phosphonate transport system substrate-binding protein